MVELALDSLRNDANLVSYYRLEGNGNDELGLNNGTASNVSFSAGEGKFGQGGAFNGTSSVATIADSASLDVSGALSIVAWVKPNTPSGDGVIFGKGNFGSTANIDYGLYMTSSRTIGMGVSNGTTYKEQASSAITDSVYSLVVGVYVPSTSITIYINGVQDAQNTSAIISSIQTNTKTAAIGRDGDATTRYLKASLDDIALFNRELTAGEILRLYQDATSGMPMLFGGGVAIG